VRRISWTSRKMFCEVGSGLAMPMRRFAEGNECGSLASRPRGQRGETTEDFHDKRPACELELEYQMFFMISS
jgi:hypothetical protein